MEVSVQSASPVHAGDPGGTVNHSPCPAHPQQRPDLADKFSGSLIMRLYRESFPPSLGDESTFFGAQRGRRNKKSQSLGEFGEQGTRGSETRFYTQQLLGVSKVLPRGRGWHTQFSGRKGNTATSILGPVGGGHWPGVEGKQGHSLLCVLAPAPTVPLFPPIRPLLCWSQSAEPWFRGRPGHCLVLPP